MKSLYKKMYAVGALVCAVQTFSFSVQAENWENPAPFVEIECQKTGPYGSLHPSCRRPNQKNVLFSNNNPGVPYVSPVGVHIPPVPGAAVIPAVPAMGPAAPAVAPPPPAIALPAPAMAPPPPPPAAPAPLPAPAPAAVGVPGMQAGLLPQIPAGAALNPIPRAAPAAVAGIPDEAIPDADVDLRAAVFGEPAPLPLNILAQRLKQALKEREQKKADGNSTTEDDTSTETTSSYATSDSKESTQTGDGDSDDSESWGSESWDSESWDSEPESSANSVRAAHLNEVQEEEEEEGREADDEEQYLDSEDSDSREDEEE